jgi:prolyl-tRNA editing enzyme YbaK/EbsC (Cys-tRNA(Pro) deacylase)
VTEISHPAIQRMIDVASRKGMALDMRVLSSSTRTTQEIALAVDAEVGQMVETVVFVARRPDGQVAPIVCLVSGRNEIDLALLAAVTGEVAIRPASAREVREMAGFSAGSVPPFGHGRDVRVLMDQDLCQYEWVWASAGTEGAVFRVQPRTLRMLANAVVAPLAAASWMTSPAMVEPRLQFEAGSGA